MSFSRQDSEQQLGGVSVTTPPGLAGVIKGVAQCPEPQAGQGDCGPESLIGQATVAVGVGPAPYWVHGGRVYLTGPYNDGPFGLSIVVPTSAGPYTLTGNGGYGREVVRNSIRVNPTTAQVTVLSDPLPSNIQGIQLDVKSVQVTVNRPGFIFNPTSCAQLAVTAAFTSTQGATASGSTPFYASGCAQLPFAPEADRDRWWAWQQTGRDELHGQDQLPRPGAGEHPQGRPDDTREAPLEAQHDRKSVP